VRVGGEWVGGAGVGTNMCLSVFLGNGGKQAGKQGEVKSARTYFLILDLSGGLHAHARPLHPAALAFVPYGIVLVRGRVRAILVSWSNEP